MPYSSNAKYAGYFFAVIIFFFGLNHLIIPDVMVKEMPTYLPFPKLLVYLVGVILILCSVAFFTHKKMTLAGYVLGIMIVAIAFIIHGSGILYAGSLDERKLAAILFAKDMAIAAGAFYIGSKPE